MPARPGFNIHSSVPTTLPPSVRDHTTYQVDWLRIYKVSSTVAICQRYALGERIG